MKKTGILLIAICIIIIVYLEIKVDTQETNSMGTIHQEEIKRQQEAKAAAEEKRRVKTAAAEEAAEEKRRIETAAAEEAAEEKRRIETAAAEEAAKQSEIHAKFLKEKSEEFVDNKDGTVTSRITGLMWQRCSVGQTWTGTTCSGGDPELDKMTGDDAMKTNKMTWDDAMKLKSNFAGYNDWRLPTKDELTTLIYCYDGQYTKDGACENRHLSNDHPNPTINLTAFPTTQALSFWSSSSYTNFDDMADDVDFELGEPRWGQYKSYIKFVRLVR